MEKLSNLNVAVAPCSLINEYSISMGDLTARGTE